MAGVGVGGCAGGRFEGWHHAKKSNQKATS